MMSINAMNDHHQCDTGNIVSIQQLFLLKKLLNIRNGIAAGFPFPVYRLFAWKSVVFVKKCDSGHSLKNKFTFVKSTACHPHNVKACMNKPASLIGQLFSIRNRYGKQFASEKEQLLKTLMGKPVKGKAELQMYYDALLFLLAHPGTKTIYSLAGRSLKQLQLYIQSNEKVRASLFNTGVTGTTVCAAFSFEMIKWLRKNHPKEIKLSSIEAADGQIQSILSAVMPKTESEILQDANASWRSWLEQYLEEEEDLLDAFIAVFDSSDIRPEVKDELWLAIGINVEINFPVHCCLGKTLVVPYYGPVNNKNAQQRMLPAKPTLVKLNKTEEEQIIYCSRTILIRHLREIDPISYTGAGLISYYQLSDGLSIALMGMVPERRHPVDSYMGYVVFKNGLPVAYAGSWILFDSGRIGLNVFPAYRGGESRYIFQQVLQLHSRAYHLKRFSIDPYQIGKKNSDGIHSGAFWVYYRAGFRPIKKEQKELAETEALKIKSIHGYRTAGTVLKKLADSRMELLIKKGAVQFDATDISLAFAAILSKKYQNNRRLAAERSVQKLAGILEIKNYQEGKMNFILKNWSYFLLVRAGELSRNSTLKKALKKIFTLKATGSEENYIDELQRAEELRKYLESIMNAFQV